VLSVRPWGIRVHLAAGEPCTWSLPLRNFFRLALRKGSEAATEFQKFLDHRGWTRNDPKGAPAHLGLARAYALQGDTGKARAAYDDFFALWKDADPNIPVWKQAKAEYGKS
jgi:predicted Zn-dependent protease